MHPQGPARRSARVGESLTVSLSKPAIALRYALAPACIGVSVLLYVSPLGELFHPTGPFILGVLVAAWFGGAGPGVFAALLSAFSFPQLIAMTGPLPTDYPLLGGFFDLPRFITLGLTGAAVGWGTGSYRRVSVATSRSMTRRCGQRACASRRRSPTVTSSARAVSRSARLLGGTGRPTFPLG